MKNTSIASELHRSNLSTFAIVEAQLTKGLKHPTDYLLPFFQEMIRREDGNNFIVKNVVENIQEEFALDIPVYLADSLVPSLVKQGYLEYDKAHRCHICHKVAAFGSEILLEDSDFNVIEKTLGEYAGNNGTPKPLVSSDWLKALLAFFSQEQVLTKYKKVGKKIISNPKEYDDRVISNFIVNSERYDPIVFAKIKKIYAAFSLADTIISIQNTGHLEDWGTLRLAYDVTVLMRLLGTSGDLLKRATLEMHSLLQGMGCRTYYFDHTLSELYSNIDALAVRYSRGESIHRETAQALENGEISIASINLIKGNADVQLGRLNITQIDVPPRIENALYQVNPQELEEYLTRRINYRFTSEAARADAESIEKIVFLRRGRKATDLPKSGHIFVTNNAPYARVSRDYAKEFCKYGDFDTPPIITLSTLTKLSWLASDRKNLDHEISTDLLANCFQASLPDDKWFNKFWQTIEESHPELIDSNVHDSLYLLDVRRAAEEASIGNSALFDDIDFPKLIANAKEARTKREKMHQDELEKLKQDNDLAIQAYQNRIESIRQEHEEQIKETDHKKASEIETIKDELRLGKNDEFQKQKQKHTDELSHGIQRTKDELQESIANSVANKARSQARVASKIVTFILASVFAGIFILSLVEQLPTWIPAEYTLHIKVIAVILGVVQIVGLFVEKFSFLFFGPLFQKYLEARLERYYRNILP